MAVVLPSAARSAQISLTPTADAFVSAANPNSNYGGAGGLAVSAAGLPKGEFGSLLQFDLAAAKAAFDGALGAGAWTIQSVTLTLTATPPNNPLFNGNAAGPGGSNVNFAGRFSLDWVQTDAWLEGTGTPAAPSGAGVTNSGLSGILGGGSEVLGTFDFNGATSGAVTYNLTLTPGLVGDVTAGSLLSLHGHAADSNVSALVNSRSAGATSSRPTLTITAVPEPATSSLALAAIPVFYRRRRA